MAPTARAILLLSVSVRKLFGMTETGGRSRLLGPTLGESPMTGLLGCDNLGDRGEAVS